MEGAKKYLHTRLSPTQSEVDATASRKLKHTLQPGGLHQETP
jgi:hypothetical protein